MPPDNPFEVIPEGEAAQIQEIADLTVELLDMRYGPGRILRGVHPKSHGCVDGVFEIREDLSEDLRVGLFARPGARHKARVRYSNASVRVAHDLADGNHGSRGMAIKVLDVDGDVLLADTGDKASQDFLMINQPAFAFANVKDYLRLTKIILAHEDDARPFFAPLRAPTDEFSPEDMARILESFQAVQKIQSIPVANPLTVSYFGAAPFLFGPDRVMHFCAEPSGGEKPQVLPDDPSENYLGEALRETMAGTEDVLVDFKIQVRGLDDGDLGIESAFTVWDESDAPWIDVARLTLPAPQPNIDAPGQLEKCENLVFTPWHCLPEHQPIGGINRLRKAVYLASETHRGAGRGRGRGSRGRSDERKRT